MDKEQIIKSIQNIVKSVKDAFNRIKRFVFDAFQRGYQLNDNKEQPKNVSNIHEYLEKKKKSEPFYKAVNGNKKPWE